jgi:hypothetical protein
MRNVETFPVTLPKTVIAIIEETLPKGKIRASTLTRIIEEGLKNVNTNDSLVYEPQKLRRLSSTPEGKKEIISFYKRLNTFMRSYYMTGKSGFTKEVEGID